MSSARLVTISPAAPTITVSAYPLALAPLSNSPAIPVAHSQVPQSARTSKTTFAALPRTPSVTTSKASSTSGPAAPLCEDCCESPPPFIIGFDDLPHFSIGNNPAETDIPPIFNPYHKLFFQDHFGYYFPLHGPFPPQSPPNVAIYREAGLTSTGSPDAGLLLLGEIGSGLRASDSAYWIDAHSVWFGCANSGPDDCTININGYTIGSTTPTVTQIVTQPPCPGLKNCSLALIEFSNELRHLTGLQIIARVGSDIVDYYMDDLELAWSNNTCSAQEERGSSE